MRHANLLAFLEQ